MLSPLDLEALRAELTARPDEERDILIVSLGIQQDARQWVDDYNRNRPVNRLHVIELRTDRKYGGFIRHEPMSADVTVSREGDQVIVDIRDVLSPAILQRLNLDQGQHPRLARGGRLRADRQPLRRRAVQRGPVLRARTQAGPGSGALRTPPRPPAATSR